MATKVKAKGARVTQETCDAVPDKPRATRKGGAPKRGAVVALRIAPAGSHDAAPVHAAPVHAAPVHAAPVHAAPVHAAPVHAAPVHAAPVHAAPVHAAPRETSPAPRPPRRPNGARKQFTELRDALAGGWEIVQPVFARPLWSSADDSLTAFSFVLRRDSATRLVTVPGGRLVERFIASQQLKVDERR